jgi:hypothetical protein
MKTNVYLNFKNQSEEALKFYHSILGGNLDFVKVKPEANSEADDKIVEGIFDGQNMIGDNGKTYPVPANYSSKSHLVQGQVLKLTFMPDGKMLYKQPIPIEKKQLVGVLNQRDGNFYVEANSKEYKVLMASVTFFKLKNGDSVSVLVPTENEDVEWAAIESLI